MGESLMSVALRQAAERNMQFTTPEFPSGKPVGPLVLDLSGVEMLSAAGLTELVDLHRRLREMGGELVLVNVNDQVYEIFQVAHLTRLLNVRPKSASSVGRA
jgi:anti-anti-sigma factor